MKSEVTSSAGREGLVSRATRATRLAAINLQLAQRLASLLYYDYLVILVQLDKPLEDTLG